jgi:hypothetical protein
LIVDNLFKVIRFSFGKVLARTSQGVGKVLARIMGLLELANGLAMVWLLR